MTGEVVSKCRIEDGTGFMSMDTMHASANPRYSTMSTTSVTGGPNPSAKGFSGLNVEQEAQAAGDAADRAFRYFSTREPCSALYGACRYVRAERAIVGAQERRAAVWCVLRAGVRVLKRVKRVSL